MVPSARERTPVPPGNSPGGSWAFVFMFTVLINLGFAAFVLIMGYPLWTLLAAIVFTVMVGVTIRHIHTGTGIVIPRLTLPGQRALSYGTRILWRVLQAVMDERQAATNEPDDQPAPDNEESEPAERGGKAEGLAKPTRTRKKSGAKPRSARSGMPRSKKGAA